LGYEISARTDLLDGTALRRDLIALATAETDQEKRRGAAFALVMPALQQARGRVLTRLENGTLSGLWAARAFCDIQDLVVQNLCDFATKHLYGAHGDSEQIAVVATGGYGRGFLAPASDIDLVFLRPRKQTAWGESVIELIVRMLWDLGLKVGHAARSLDECLLLALEDMTVRTSLLEARFVSGEMSLCDDLRIRFRAEVANGTGENFVEAKLAEREARHNKQGASRYLVEPNIKDGKGGLRDLQTLYWLGKYIYGVDDPADLADHGVFTRDEHRTFHAAEAFLWNVRCHLHCVAGRAQERLSFDVQPEVARRLGFVDANPRLAVERFMRAYFLVAKDVGDLTRIFCAALEDQNRKGPQALSHPRTVFPLPPGSEGDFCVENGRVTAFDDAFVRDPVNLIRIFHFADATELELHPHALRTITRSLDLITNDLREDRTANRLFLEILTSRRNPEQTLRHMNEAGVLGRFVPPFAHAVALMQFNMYHHYTVDEHLIRAVGIVSAIERGELREDHPLASDLTSRIKSREALYCAVLLHDVAKGMQGNHSEIGAAIAQSLCPRFGLSEGDTATTVWLVRNHLVMSDTAQRRDISDPATLRNFVAAVQSPELLRLLLVFTVADIRAVGPGVLNGWKGELLRELYRGAEKMMTGAPALPELNPRIALAKETLSQRLANGPDGDRADALAHHRDNYWLAFDDAELERHARLRFRAKEQRQRFALEADTDEFRAVSEITVFAADRPGLFSHLAGAISACGGSIVEAKAFTTADGHALDVFRVQDPHGRPFGDAGRVSRLRRAIARALDGTLPDQAMIARCTARNRAAAFHVPSRVNFDNDASATANVIEVEGADRPALLFDIARAIFEQGLSISSAIVATYGERAVDIFYVCDGLGHKVSHPEHLARIRGHLLKALASAP